MRYTVNRHAEEFGCPTCGAPVYVGESAWHDKKTDRVFCCRKCAESYRVCKAIPTGTLDLDALSQLNALDKRDKAQHKLQLVRDEINSGTWTGASIRLYELRQEEATLLSQLDSPCGWDHV